MKKITEEYLKDYVSEVGEFEKEHLKGSSFYCNASHTFTQTDIEELKGDGVDASDFLNVCVCMNGDWSDDWGTEWHSVDYFKVEEVKELVPEKIIPEHWVVKTKSEKFVPVWS